MGEKNRHFSREFKINAVQLVTEKKMSVRKVAEELVSDPSTETSVKSTYDSRRLSSNDRANFTKEERVALKQERVSKRKKRTKERIARAKKRREKG